jgi:hypothetical protein
MAMLFWKQIFRTQPPLSPGLSLDLSRLKRVLGILGIAEPSLDLNRLGAIDQLHVLNRYLGDRLGSSSARERVIVARAFTKADDALPDGVTKNTALIGAAERDGVCETGCADLGRGLSTVQVEAIHDHLRSKSVLLAHDAHITTKKVASLSEVPDGSNYACYDYHDLWSSPHILELATSAKILGIAQDYLGCTPTLYSINAFWSLPNLKPHPYSQLFHRDWEDYRSLVVFTQLTPVEVPEDGAHYYVEGSHDPSIFQGRFQDHQLSPGDIEILSGRNGPAIASMAEKLFQGSARRFDGPAGRSFCGDGYGLHRAVVPQTRPRLLLWMRFGTFYNQTMYKMPVRTDDHEVVQRILGRIPETERLQYVFRYLIDALSGGSATIPRPSR